MFFLFLLSICFIHSCSFLFYDLLLTDTQPLPILNTSSSKTEEEKENDNMPSLSSASSTSKLNPIDENKTIISDSLNEVKVRSPRSRAAVIISLPLEVIDFDEPITQQQPIDHTLLKSDVSSLPNPLAFNNSTYVSNNNINNNILNIASNNNLDKHKGIFLLLLLICYSKNNY